ncbi:uncharacterized protein DSM5745_03617 [Aspergillus mulundensis]|uniref:Uncharacterized protein n=1 Tax=Aspergillus mulundensis TaxID=1810919 RepID=A0A3D8SKV9_9EURO|nr:hypothetical protein DSM5745_03617 [Aspergillus mulundensis]RDW86975.1 hypothetical protein DSM5745_03617 [Aspergillus mulundensis]
MDDHPGPFQFTTRQDNTSVSIGVPWTAVFAEVDEHDEVTEVIGDPADRWEQETGISVRVLPQPQLGVYSLLLIGLRIRYRNTDDGKVREQDAYVYLTEAILESYRVKRVFPDIERNTQCQSQSPLGKFLKQSTLPYKQVWRLQVRLRNHDFLDAYLFNNRTFGDQSATMERIRGYLKTHDVLTLYLRTSGSPEQSLNNLREYIQRDRDVNPYDAWYPAGQNVHILSAKNCQSPERRPRVEYMTRTNYLWWSDYATILEYSIVSENDESVRAIAALENQEIPLRLVTLPDT